MCGIVGIISKRHVNNIKIKDDLMRSLQITKHRGPDHTGISCVRNQDWNICLGMNRLSILDVSSKANQPMSYKDYIIVFNGEIYNFIEIRDELLKRGHAFKTTSDTEVILHAWEEWGINSIYKFNGMFGIAILDIKNGKLYLIRDRLGEKPLYYYESSSAFIFSSELKGILLNKNVNKSLDISAIYNYLIFNSVPTPYTLFREIKQLPPGYYMVLDFSQDSLKKNLVEYWKLPPLEEINEINERKVLDELEELIYDAVRLRLRSDVPVGIFLSGGIDSTLIAAIASKIHPNIKAFTIGYKDKKHDESDRAKIFAKSLKLDHQIIYLSEKDINLNFSDLSYISDDGVANITLLPAYYLSLNTRKYVKVALSGDGGDEFFCGYTNYKLISYFYRHRKLLKLLKPFSFINIKLKILNNISYARDIDEFMANFRIRNNINILREIFVEKVDKYLKLYKFYYLSNLLKDSSVSFWKLNYYDGAGNYLVDTVLKTTDRVSMFHSLEVRPVLTDYRFPEYVCKLPENVLYKNGIDKYLLRTILRRYVNSDIVFKLPKKGFSVPFMTDYKELFSEAIMNTIKILSELQLEIFNTEGIKKFLLTKDLSFVNLKLRLVFLFHFLYKWLYTN